MKALYDTIFAGAALDRAIESGLPADKLYALQVANRTNMPGFGTQTLQALTQSFEHDPTRRMPPTPRTLEAVGTGWIDRIHSERHKAVAAALGFWAGVLITEPRDFDEYLIAASLLDDKSDERRRNAIRALSGGRDLRVVFLAVPGTISLLYGVEVIATDETNFRRRRTKVESGTTETNFI